MVKYALKIFEKNLQLMLDISSGLVMVNFETNLQARISKSRDGLTEALQLDMQLMQMFFFYQVDGKVFRFLYLNPCI